jgi:hypothetical protein
MGVKTCPKILMHGLKKALRVERLSERYTQMSVTVPHFRESVTKHSIHSIEYTLYRTMGNMACTGTLRTPWAKVSNI